MSHTIPVNRKVNKRVTPLALYEGNFRRILKLFPELLDANQQGNSGGMLTSPNDASIQLKIIEQHRYTSIVKLYKLISEFRPTEPGSKKHDSIKYSPVKKAHMILRVCFDARLVEVITFQGSQPVKMYPSYPNKEMFLPDEKKQLNYHLKYILEMSLDCMPEDVTSDLLLLKP